MYHPVMINTIIGERCPVFDYTEKKIVTIMAQYQALDQALVFPQDMERNG